MTKPELRCKLDGKNIDKEFIIDSEDYTKISQFKWYLDGRGYIVSSGRRHKLHRLILDVHDCLIQVDHINGNKLDNRKDNLRLVSNQQNQMNIHKKKGTSSKYFGVCLDGRIKLTNRWIASIKVDYKNIFLGRFNTEIEAALAYNNASEKYGFFTRNIL